MDTSNSQSKLAAIVRELAITYRSKLEELKREYVGLSRPDFLWHYLLQSFSTMGRSSGWHGLIGNQQNYRRLQYPVLEKLSVGDRKRQVVETCRKAAIRMPDRKAEFILGCFQKIQSLGGPEKAKELLLKKSGREGKIRFLESFPGIGPKYARNIMMDVYHEDFRDSIAIDVRISAITKALGLSFSSYAAEEKFLLDVARDARLNGWELDRLLYNYRSIVESKIGLVTVIAVPRDAAKRDAIKRDAIKRDAIKRDAIKRDAIKRDAIKRDAIKRDAIKRDAIKRDAIKQRNVAPIAWHSAAVDKTPWGSGIATGAGALDTVILDIPIGREFTETEVAAEVRRRGLPARGAVREHLQNRLKKGLLSKTPTGWKRLKD